MKLYVLKRIAAIEIEDISAPYIYDTADSLLIRAEDEEHARRIANTPYTEPCGTMGGITYHHYGDEGPIWEDPALVSCEEVTGEGEVGVLIRDFHNS